MARAPFEVLVYPYRRVGEGVVEYALLKRADAGFWQGVAGGGEKDETPLQAARREAYEEAGIPAECDFLALDTLASVPVTEFRDGHLWGDEVYVIPEYCFGVAAPDGRLALSDEHTGYGWFPYEQARSLVRLDADRTALWELDRRLAGRGPRGTSSPYDAAGDPSLIQGVDVVYVHSPVRDLAGWYAEVLGLEIAHVDGDWTEYRTQGGARFAVEQVGDPRSVVEDQPIVVSFRVADIDRAVETLAVRGVRFFPTPATTIFEAGPSLVATSQDPAGHWVQLSQRKEPAAG